MDGTLILIGSKQEVDSDLAVINQVAAEYWASLDYVVEHGATGLELLGKNALTGITDNTAQRTTTWDIPKEYNQFWYIYSPSNNPQYAEWRERGELAGYIWKTEEIEWVNNGQE